MARTLPRNADVAEQLDLLADLLELEGEPAFRVIAYRRAATRIRETPGSVAQLALEGKAKELQGIGKTIEEKIVQIVERRRDPRADEAEGGGARRGRPLHAAARARPEDGRADLEGARRSRRSTGCRRRRRRSSCARLGGLGAKTRGEDPEGARARRRRRAERRRCSARACPPCSRSSRRCAEHPAADLVSEAGSVRRRKETFRDLDIIATATDPGALTDVLRAARRGSPRSRRTATRRRPCVSHDGLRFDLRVVPPESYGNLLQHFTGSKDHNVALREDAVKRGPLGLGVRRQDVETGEVFTTARRGGALRVPRLPVHPARAAREPRRARRRARAASCRELVELGDLRGDLHTHTTWSRTARTRSRRWRARAIERGYEYLAISDHSQHLRGDRLAAQGEEIDGARRAGRAVPDPPRDRGRTSAPTARSTSTTRRSRSSTGSSRRSTRPSTATRPSGVLAAMENPHVDCIGHPDRAQDQQARAGATSTSSA